MTGETPRHIKALVLNPEQVLQEIVPAPKQDQDDVDRVVGEGFVVNQPMETNRPTAELLLSKFNNLHLLIEEKGKKISA